MLIAALASGLILMAETTAAPAAPPTTGQPVAAAEKPKLICHKITPLGSRMPKKVCQTPGEIAQERVDAKEMLRDLQKGQVEPVH
jgi:hypothetical protein